MSWDFVINSTTRIDWNEFINYLFAALPRWDMVDMYPDIVFGDRWFQQAGTGIQYRFSLIHRDDGMGFLVQDSRDELNQPFEAMITVSVYGKPAGSVTQEEYHKFNDSKDRLTLEIVCVIAEKWPLVVDTDNVWGKRDFYDNDMLFRRLKDGLGLFQ